MRRPRAAGLPVTWDDKTLAIDGKSHPVGALAVVFPEGERLSAAVFTTAGSEYLLFRFQPLRPIASAPDFLLWDDKGTQEAGFFDPTWKGIDPAPLRPDRIER